MIRRQVLLVVGVVLGAVLVYSPVIGQDGAAKQKSVQTSGVGQLPESAQGTGPEKQQIRIFRLQEIHPGETITMLENLLGGSNGLMGSSAGGGSQSAPRVRFSPDLRTRSIVAVGDTEALKQVEALLRILDVPKPTPPNWTTGLEMSFGNDDRDDSRSYAVPLIERWILKEGSIRWSDRGNDLIYTGPKAEEQLVEEFLGVLGRQATGWIGGDVQMRLVWLVDSSLMDKNAAQVPPDLSVPIAKLAKRVGIGELRTAAQILVNVNRMDAEFKAAGTAALGEEYCLEFTGVQELMRSLKEHKVDVTISARRQGSDKALINQNTKIVTSPGRPVILGVTPIGSKASVFVVEILDISADDAEGQPDSK